MNLIEFNQVHFSHSHRDDARTPNELKGVSFVIAEGEYVALLGGDACGKTTLLKLCNALLLPDRGEILVKGANNRDEERLPEIRRSAAMVFQDPDGQILGTTVEEDVAFGPENLGLPSALVEQRVADALEALSLRQQAGTPVHLLTPWEKLKLALAGALAMRPDCLLVDDAAAELEVHERAELPRLLHALNRERGIAVLYATGDVDAASAADRILLLKDGRIALDVTASHGVAVPEATQETARPEVSTSDGNRSDAGPTPGSAGLQAYLAAAYLPGESRLHRCDPRTKLALALLMTAAAFTLTTPASLALLLAVTVALACRCGRPLGHSLRSLRPILCLALVASAVSLAGADGPPLSDHGLLRHISRDGAELSLLMVLRLLLMAATASLLCGTTTPTTLGDGLEKTLRPLARVGVPVAQLSAMLQVSLRLLPVLANEAEQLLRELPAPSGRGAAGFPGRLALLPPLLASLFGRVARRGEAMAEAMEARCYQGPARRGRMRPLSFSGADLSGAALFLVVMLAAAGVEYLRR